MSLALDTATIIDLVRGRSAAVRAGFRAAARSGTGFVIPVAVMHELVSGIATSRNPQTERDRLELTLVGLPVIELTPEDVEATGLLAGQLRRAGTPIGDIDTLIAGQALARGWTLVSSNVRHFGRAIALPIIDWSVGPEPLAPGQIADRVSGR